MGELVVGAACAGAGRQRETVSAGGGRAGHASLRGIHYLGIGRAEGGAQKPRIFHAGVAVELRKALPESVAAGDGQGGHLPVHVALVEQLRLAQRCAGKRCRVHAPDIVQDVGFGPDDAGTVRAHVVNLETLGLAHGVLDDGGALGGRQIEEPHLGQGLGGFRGKQAGGNGVVAAPDERAEGQLRRAGQRDGVLVVFHLFQVGLRGDGAFGHLKGFQGVVVAGAPGCPSGPAAHGGQRGHARHAVEEMTARQQDLVASGQGEGCGLFCCNAPRGRGSSLWHGTIVSFRIRLGDHTKANATINANTTAGLIYALSTDEIAGQRNEALAS